MPYFDFFFITKYADLLFTIFEYAFGITQQRSNWNSKLRSSTRKDYSIQLVSSAVLNIYISYIEIFKCIKEKPCPLILVKFINNWGFWLIWQNEPMQSWFVRGVSLLLSLVSSLLVLSSVYSCPCDSFDHRNVISYTYLHKCL